MTILNYIFAPKLFREYGVGALHKLYEPSGLEKWGDQIISTLSLLWNIGYYTSPLLVTFLYRRGYLVAESISSVAKFTTGLGLIYVISLCMRGFGRSQSQSYQKFVKALELSKTSAEGRRLLRGFDYDFKHWKVDFDANSVEGDGSKKNVKKSKKQKPFWISSLPCEVIAYIAIHTFGIRMIYPGSVKLLQSYLRPMLIQGRSKLVEVDNGQRNKVKTRDGNEIDTMFVDNRNATANGKTLVICSEGNAGFYEVGIMSTPIALNYSVLGWNHPGFDGSTGQPFPNQDQNAIDGVIQFAIHQLGFNPEDIIMFGWSIGGYSSLWAGTQYPELKGIIVDATFDDILYLALPRMPESLSSIVKIAIRDYVNLNNMELVSEYHGPLLMIRRSEDEIIAEDNRIESNRGNFLCIGTLKNRFPNIFQSPQIKYAQVMLSKTLENVNKPQIDDECMSKLTAYVSDNSKSYPLQIGADFTDEQRTQMADFLIRKHFLDFKSTHCTPLPTEFFKLPWDIPSENDFVFT